MQQASELTQIGQCARSLGRSEGLGGYTFLTSETTPIAIGFSFCLLEFYGMFFCTRRWAVHGREFISRLSSDSSAVSVIAECRGCGKADSQSPKGDQKENKVVENKVQMHCQSCARREKYDSDWVVRGEDAADEFGFGAPISNPLLFPSQKKT